MNIFYLDSDPVLAAKAHCDKHVTKMCVEYAQIMSTAHHRLESSISPYLYKPTHKNHPCVVWAASGWLKYSYVYRLWEALAAEFHARRGRPHASWEKLRHWLVLPPACLVASTDWDEPPQCVPEKFQRETGDGCLSACVMAYRDYYSNGRVQDFASYDWGTPPPDWMISQNFFEKLSRQG